MSAALAHYKLEGRTAVVTGEGGIGSAIAEQFCALGARVVLADVRGDVEATARRLAKAGHETHATTFDVTDSSKVEFPARDLNVKYGPIDILVANAGMFYERNTLGHSDGDWRRAIATKLDSGFYCTRAFGRAMVQRQRGSIVRISSIAGAKVVRSKLHVGYDVSKAGVARMCCILGVEWAAYNVRVKAVGPGYTDTEMPKNVGIERPEVMAAWLKEIPMKRLLQPREIAASVAFLASDASRGSN